MKIYVAGPYTHPDPVLNTRNAILAGEEIVQLGHIPFIPHLNLIWHLVAPHNDKFWYDYDFTWLQNCDVVLRLPGDSKGADEEVELARTMGIPVFHSIQELRERL